MTSEDELVPMSLTLWVVYKDLKAFPGKFVAKKWFVNKFGYQPYVDRKYCSTSLIAAGWLEDLRRSLPPGLLRIEPNISHDRAKIVEAWVSPCVSAVLDKETSMSEKAGDSPLTNKVMQEVGDCDGHNGIREIIQPYLEELEARRGLEKQVKEYAVVLTDFAREVHERFEMYRARVKFIGTAQKLAAWRADSVLLDGIKSTVSLIVTGAGLSAEPSIEEPDEEERDRLVASKRKAKYAEQDDEDEGLNEESVSTASADLLSSCLHEVKGLRYFSEEGIFAVRQIFQPYFEELKLRRSQAATFATISNCKSENLLDVATSEVRSRIGINTASDGIYSAIKAVFGNLIYELVQLRAEKELRKPSATTLELVDSVISRIKSKKSTGDSSRVLNNAISPLAAELVQLRTYKQDREAQLADLEKQLNEVTDELDRLPPVFDPINTVRKLKAIAAQIGDYEPGGDEEYTEDDAEDQEIRDLENQSVYKAPFDREPEGPDEIEIVMALKAVFYQVLQVSGEIKRYGIDAATRNAALNTLRLVRAIRTWVSR